MTVYKVLNVFPVGKNTSVTIEGNGEKLKNNMTIKDLSGSTYRLLTVAMVSGGDRDTTTLMIEGKFRSKSLVV